MRPRVVLLIAAALAILVIGGVLWYATQVDTTRQATPQQEDIDPVAVQEQEAAQAAQEAEEAEAAALEEPAAPDEPLVQEEPATAADEDAIVVGDEITEDTTVIEPAGDAVILDPDETTTTAEIVEDEPADTGAPGTAPGTAPATGAAAQLDAEEILTPENFDRDEVLVLINEAEQLTPEERSTLSALVDGASANPAMVDSTINAIRAALDLPPLD